MACQKDSNTWAVVGSGGQWWAVVGWGGLVVSFLAFYSDDPSSNPVEFFLIWLVSMLLSKLQ